MKNNRLVLTLGIIITSTIIILSSCKKINEATSLGDDLIPPVDNITTFDTTLSVEVYNDSFTVATDSTLSDPTYTHYLGRIDNDPLFGKTDAQIFLELKPNPEQYPYTFLNKSDSLELDSVVLVLDYVETYGDTTVPQTVSVREIGGQIGDFRYDTTYRLRENAIPKAGLLGSRTVIPMTLNDSVKAYQDTTVNQLRIRLDNSFGERLLNYDSSNVYKNDSNFRQALKGFAIESSGGNAVMGFNLSGTNTKLAIYYRYHNKDEIKFDTTVAYFGFSTLSASANLVRRDYTGTPLAAAANGTTAPPDDFAYIQTTPGTFARIKIPGLAGLGNSVVHRAELIMEEVYDVSDTLFPPPGALYLDAYDPAAAGTFRNIPFDFFFDVSGASNIASFGAAPFNSSDPSGNPIRTWHFNLSRYVQHIVNGTASVYDLRLHAPVYTYNQYYPNGSTTATTAYVGVNAAPVKGRVRLRGGDSSPTPNPQRMRLRIVYSKI